MARNHSISSRSVVQSTSQIILAKFNRPDRRSSLTDLGCAYAQPRARPFEDIPALEKSPLWVIGKVRDSVRGDITLFGSYFCPI